MPQRIERRPYPDRTGFASRPFGRPPGMPARAARKLTFSKKRPMRG